MRVSQWMKMEKDLQREGAIKRKKNILRKFFFYIYRNINIYRVWYYSYYLLLPLLHCMSFSFIIVCAIINNCILKKGRKKILKEIRLYVCSKCIDIISTFPQFTRAWCRARVMLSDLSSHIKTNYLNFCCTFLLLYFSFLLRDAIANKA